MSKVALVTGVGRRNGIGTAICVELAKQGCHIFYTYWPQYDIENYPNSATNPIDLAEELRAFGVEVGNLELDLSRPDAATILFTKVKEQVGAPDILINNAAYSTRQPLSEVTAALLDKHYAVNVRATILLCREFAAEGKTGQIINLTSGQALGPMPDELPYTITKASVDMLTKQLAPELEEKGISINAFDPGPTDTGWMTDQMKEAIIKESKNGRIKTPAEAAKQIVQLIDQDITGQIIHARW